MTIARSMIPANEEFHCSRCGAQAGGCENPKKCAEDLDKMEEVCIGKIKSLIDDQPDSHPFHLMTAGFDALDLLNLGLAVTDGSGRLLLANRTAEHILEMRDGLQLTSRLVLQGSLRSCPDLLGFVQQATRGSRPGEPNINHLALAVPRPSGKRPITLVVRSANGLTEDEHPPVTAVLVFILDPELPVEADAAELSQLYGLTAAETRVANLLMQGKSLDDCCAELGVRRPTVCTHLRQLFKKTHVQRQSQLVSLLFKSIGLMRQKTVSRNTPTAGFSPFDPRHLDLRDPRLFRNLHSSGRRQ